MDSAGPEQLSRPPVITARLGRLLGVVLLLFSLLVVNSVYLAAITWLEYRSGEIYQDYFYLLMFLLHLGLGLLLVLPLLLFALAHMQRAWRRPNRMAANPKPARLRQPATRSPPRPFPSAPSSSSPRRCSPS